MSTMPATAFDRLRYYFNRCKPDAPIEAGDPDGWYVDFDAQHLRGEPCAAVLESRVSLAEGPTCQLFTGFSGSGKTSELRRLVGKLETLGYLVVYADALDTIDAQSPIEFSNILFALGLAVDQKLVELGWDGTSKRWLNRFANEVKDLLVSDVELKKFTLKTGGGGVAAAELALELKGNPSFRTHMQKASKDRRRNLLDQAHSFFGAVDEKARSLDYQKGLMVILDNLEKLSLDPDVHKSVKAVFLHQVDALQAPGVHLIYTIPPELVFSLSGPKLSRLYDGPPQVLPMVKVRDRLSGEVHRRGHDALRDLLGRRLDFDEVFGGRDEPVEALVTNCGGYARDLLRLTQFSLQFSLQYSLQSAESLPVNEGNVEKACAMLRRSYERAYSTDDLPLLEFVKANRPWKIPEEYQHRLEEVVTGHFILSYGNDSEWYDVHPLMTQVLHAIAGEKARRATPDAE